MTRLKVQNLESLRHLSDDRLQARSDKTRGAIHLMKRQLRSPVAYRVPSGFDIPPRICGNYSSQDIRKAYERLTKGWKEPRALLARSSSLNENRKPGEHETFTRAFLDCLVH